MQDKYLRKLDVKLVDGDFENPVKEQVRDPEQVYQIFSKLKDKAQETLLGVYLGENLQTRLYSVLSVGAKSETAFVPDEIFKHGYITESKTFILIHNHPSGKPEPSPEDKLAITTIIEQSKTLNFNFLDFIIVGEEGYWSMFEKLEGGEYSLGAIQ